MFITKIRGVAFKNEESGVNRQKIIKKMSIDDKVFLKRDKNNKVDKHAIAVCVIQNNKHKQIGYLKAELAGIISDMWKRYEFKAKINAIKPGNDFNKIPWGVSLKIIKKRRKDNGSMSEVQKNSKK
jgi:hypothetical protein